MHFAPLFLYSEFASLAEFLKRRERRSREGDRWVFLPMLAEEGVVETVFYNSKAFSGRTTEELLV
jgi:hypothetical protein